MAIPKLLKHFHRGPSKQGYLDGSRSHHNPILIANTEYQIISAGDGLPIDYPDIVVSLGTGLETNSVQNSKRSDKTSIVSRLRGYVSAQTQQGDTKSQTASSSEGHNAWDDYLNLLPISAPASRFVRLNPKLKEGLPATDDIGGIKSLQTLVKTHYAHGDKIKRLAAQLFATLFYFECLDTIPEIANKQLIVQGKPFNLHFSKHMLS
jgi:hypothetical protein